MIVATPFHFFWVSGCIFLIFLMIVATCFWYSWFCCNMFSLFLIVFAAAVSDILDFVATCFHYFVLDCCMLPLFLFVFASFFWFRVWQTMSRSAPSARRRIRKSWILSNPRMQPGSECTVVSCRNVNKTRTLHRWVCLHSSQKLTYTFLWTHIWGFLLFIFYVLEEISRGKII